MNSADIAAERLKRTLKEEVNLWEDTEPLETFTPAGIKETLISITADRQDIDRSKLTALYEVDEKGIRTGTLGIFEIPEETSRDLGECELTFGDIRLVFQNGVLIAQKNPTLNRPLNWWEQVKLADANSKAERLARRY